MDTRENMRDILELDNYIVETAGSAAAALACTDGSSISAVILDRRLPDQSTEELIPQIRKRASDAAIIIVTDYADLDGAIAALRLGAADYILKPINPDALRAGLTRIVEHQRAKTDLRDQNARLRAIFDSAVEGIITIDEAGIIESFNPAAEEMFGYSAAEAVGKNISILMPDPYHREHDQYLREFQQTGKRNIIGTGREVLAKHRNSTTFPVHLSVSEVHLGNRRLFTGMVRDITDLKQAEQRLLQAERLAAIGQAMAALAHESRNALQRSQAGLEMLARRVQDQSEAMELIKRVQRAQDDLHELYEDVREYAAPIRFKPSETDLSEIIHHAWRDLAINREGREARIDVGQGDVRCEADEFGLRLVFRNILDNALSACDDPVDITIVFSETCLAGRVSICIEICDNGSGLTAEARQHIFDEFFTTKTHGTGLGMAICQRIILAHGGRIEADDVVPTGTRIAITLPRSQR